MNELPDSPISDETPAPPPDPAPSESESSASMFGGGFSLGRIFGIPIRVDTSVLAVAAFIAWSLQSNLPSESAFVAWAAASAGAVLFLVTILLHELGHSIVAVRRGIPVRKIRLMVFGGWSELKHEADSPGDEFVISAAGPAVSVLVGGVCLLARRFVDQPTLDLLLGWIGSINLILAGFNLLPGTPLDGGRVLRSAVWKATGNRVQGTKVAARSGQVIGMLLILGSVIAFGRLGFDAVWLGIMGWFLFALASVAHARPFTDRHLLSSPLEAVMLPVPTYVSPAIAVGTVPFGSAELLPVVGPWGEVLGVIHRSVLGRDPDRQVRDAMKPVLPSEVMSVGSTVEDLLSRVAARDFNVVVISGTEPVGIVRPYELMEFAGRSSLE